jgi:hypothetical protein
MADGRDAQALCGVLKDLAGGVNSGSSSVVGRWDVGFEALPFVVGKIGRVAPYHVAYVIVLPHPIYQTVSLALR